MTQAKRNRKTPPNPAKNTRAAASGGQAGSAKWTSTLLMLAASALMLTLLFPPFFCFFLAPFALVPFLLCILRRPMNFLHMLAYYGLGFLFFCPNLWWLASVTIPGFILLAAFVALYFLLFAVAFYRLVIHLRIPAVVAAPMLWTAIEFIRSTFVQGGFPWFILGNSLAPVPLLIQSADLFGVWTLSFLIVMLNGALVDALRQPRPKNGSFTPILGRLFAIISVTAAFVVAYGLFRLNQQTTTPGPRVAVIQDDYAQRIKDDEHKADEIFNANYRLSLQAAANTPAPDLIVWPETMVPGYTDVRQMNPTQEQLASREIKELAGTFRLWNMEQFSTDTGIPLLLGISAIDPNYEAPDDSIKQNATVLVLPGRNVTQRYNKIHLVPFGEYIPFRSLPLIGKHMVVISPYGVDYSLEPGTQWTRFNLPPHSAGENAYTFATPICFEDCMPEPARMMTAPQYSEANGGLPGRKTDFLVNVSNDGWFYPVELDQHLQAAQIRAVENRVAIARSINTGNSGFIDSNGRILQLVHDEHGQSIHVTGTATAVIPIDSRITLYAKVGDLLPIWSGILCTLLVSWTFVRPRRGIAADRPA